MFTTLTKEKKKEESQHLSKSVCFGKMRTPGAPASFTCFMSALLFTVKRASSSRRRNRMRVSWWIKRLTSEFAITLQATRPTDRRVPGFPVVIVQQNGSTRPLSNETRLSLAHMMILQWPMPHPKDDPLPQHGAAPPGAEKRRSSFMKKERERLGSATVICRRSSFCLIDMFIMIYRYVLFSSCRGESTIDNASISTTTSSFAACGAFCLRPFPSAAVGRKGEAAA